MTLYEPATFLTDLLLAAATGWAAWRLRRIPAENHAARWWSHTLAITAISALIGGTQHGLAPNFSAAIAATWWKLTLLTINLLSAAMAVSLIIEAVAPTRRRALFSIVAIKLLAFTALSLSKPLFVVAIADYGSAMLAWAVAAAVMARPWRGPMALAIALSIVAALVQQLRLAPAPWFNHNDLYHVIQLGAVVAFYRAGRCLGSAPPSTSRA